MRQSFRLNPDTNRPRESVTVTPTLTRFTATFSVGPCGSGASCPAATSETNNSAVSHPKSALLIRLHPPTHFRLFNPAIDVNTLRVFPRSARAHMQVPLKYLGIHIPKRILECSRANFCRRPCNNSTFSRLRAPFFFCCGPIHFLKVHESHAG